MSSLMNYPKIAALSFLLALANCGNKDPEWYQNPFIALPIKPGSKIEPFKTKYSKECFYLFEPDSIQDFIICNFKRTQSKRMDSLEAQNLRYQPPGLRLMVDDTLEVFGKYASVGRVKIYDDFHGKNEYMVGSHRIENGPNFVFIISRIKKRPPSDDWMKAQKEWKTAWTLKSNW